MSQENVEIVRGGWDAWLRGDLPGLFGRFDPEVWDEYRLDVEDVIEVLDGRVVSLVRQRGKGRDSGVPMDFEMAKIATLRDGKITRLDNYDTPAEALEAVALSE